MSQIYEYETLNQVLVRVGIDKLLGSIDKPALKEIKKTLAMLYLDINYCYCHPDILCMILKMIYGRSYIKIMESVYGINKNMM